MKKAIVTGCAGFIGSHLTNALLERKIEVVGIDNFHPYYSRNIKESNLHILKKNNSFSFIEGSILSEIDLSKMPTNADYVFHLAAIAGVRNSILHPKEYFEINLKGTERVLERFSHGEKIIFASTSSVYGEIPMNAFPVNEERILKPISPYGESKKQAEKICLKFQKQNKSELSILRFYTVYGPRQRPDEAVIKFLNLIHNKKPIKIYGDGNKERDFTYVKDIVDGAILAAEKGNGVYNLGTNNPTTVNELVDIIEKYLEKKVEKKFVKSPEGDVQKTHANISKAKNELGYIPKIKLEEGIKKTLEWFNENFKLF